MRPPGAAAARLAGHVFPLAPGVIFIPRHGAVGCRGDAADAAGKLHFAGPEPLHRQNDATELGAQLATQCATIRRSDVTWLAFWHRPAGVNINAPAHRQNEKMIVRQERMRTYMSLRGVAALPAHAACCGEEPAARCTCAASLLRRARTRSESTPGAGSTLLVQPGRPVLSFWPGPRGRPVGRQSRPEF